MGFAFDPKKGASNLRKHGVSFAEAEAVFFDPLAVHMADPDARDEERFVAIGCDCTSKILVVVYVMRGDDIRLISARRAVRKEVKTYEG